MILAFTGLVNVSQIGIESAKLISGTKSVILSALVERIGRCCAHGDDVLAIVQSIVIHWRRLIDISFTQTQLLVDTEFAANANNVLSFVVILDVEVGIGIRITKVVLEAHRVVGNIFVVETEDTLVADNAGYAAD